MLRTPITVLLLLFYLLRTLLWHPFKPLSDAQTQCFHTCCAPVFQVEAGPSLALLPSLASDLLLFPLEYSSSALAVPPLLVSGQHCSLLRMHLPLRHPISPSQDLRPTTATPSSTDFHNLIDPPLPQASGPFQPTCPSKPLANGA